MAVSTKRKNNFKSKSSMKTKMSSKSKSNSKTRKQFKNIRKNGMGTRKMMGGTKGAMKGAKGLWKKIKRINPFKNSKTKLQKNTNKVIVGEVQKNPYFLNTSKFLPLVEEKKQYEIVEPETEINERPSSPISNIKTAVFKKVKRTPENHAVLKFLQDKYENPYLQFSEIVQTEEQRKAIINKIKQQRRKNYMLEELVDRASELKNINYSVKPSLMGFSTKLNPQQTTL